MTADLARTAAAAALGRYTEVVDLTDGTEDPALLLLRASALDRMGRFPDALDCCSAAIEAAPLDVDAWFIQGLVLYRFGEFEQAAHLARAGDPARAGSRRRPGSSSATSGTPRAGSTTRSPASRRSSR